MSIIGERFLTYGLKNNELVHISIVDNGKACNCVCANCEHSLIAKNNINNQKASHFAHASGKDCEGAYESALHLLAKTLLSKTKSIKLPNYHHDYIVFNPKSLFREGKEVTFEEITLEQRVNVDESFIIPDAIGTLNGRQVYIEFANTHFVDGHKKAILQKLKIPSIEIDLSSTVLDEETILTLFKATTTYKSWICNPYLDEQFQAYQKSLEVQASIDKEKKVKKEKVKAQKRTETLEKELAQMFLDQWEAQKKYNQYKAEGKFLLLESSWNRHIISCPIRKDRITAMKTTIFYRHPVLKKIIDGAYWNGSFYGHPPNGKSIYIGGKQEYIFPPDSNLSSLSEEKVMNNKLFFKGMLEIKAILYGSSIGVCSQCAYSVERLILENEAYEVCRYPK